MNSEHQILRELDDNSTATQRDLANRTGMSLGSVNILIKRLVKKGLLKMERLNSRTIRYVLTPRGLKEKAEATYRYIVSSYRYIEELEAAIEKLAVLEKIDISSTVCLYGDRDEVYQIITNRLARTGADTRHADSPDELTGTKAAVLVWQPGREEELKQRGIGYINILECM